MNANPTFLTEERFKKTIALMIALVTTLIAVVSYLQSDASARDDAANRDTKRYSLEAFGKQVSGDARVNFDYNSAYQAYYELNLLANAAEAVGDSAGVARYEALRDNMVALSPMLQPPYFDPATGSLNVAKYESDTYLVEITALRERFTAASVVKEAWDSKANTYIVHLTLLAVALFLFGLATTVSSDATKWIFTVVGVAFALFATGWAAATYLKPVNDLRTCALTDGISAIDAYAQGVGLAYQNENEQAIAMFDKAIACEPQYANALAERARAHMALGNFGSAAADYESARAAGDNSGSLAGELAWAYYLLGRFDDAASMNRTALQASPGELWIQYDLALSLLAGGKLDEARSAYQEGMDSAAKQVADAQAAGAALPSDLWWALEDAALSLDDLLFVIATGEGAPSRVAIADPEAVATAASDLSTALKSLAVALEFTGQPPSGELTANVSPFVFAEPVLGDDGSVADYDVDDVFEYGTFQISILFEYEGLQDGQMYLFKVYVNGEEDPSWRIYETWELGAFGTAEIPLSLAYSNTQVLDAGFYTVELYVDNHLAQTGSFEIEEP